MLKKQKKLIHDEWDYIIVLDACRYDYCKELYNDYLDGDLRKVKSEGSCTGEWLYKTFDKKNNISYISTNPYVNSKGIPLNKCSGKYTTDWNAKDYFDEIYDLWLTHMDETLKTVLPRDVNFFIFKEYENLYEKKTIIHYMQPHLPYLTLGPLGSGKNILKKHNKNQKENYEFEKKISKISKKIPKEKFNKKKMMYFYFIFKKIIKLKPDSLTEKLWRQAGGFEEIEKYYKKNLNLVLEAVSELIYELEGDIVVTSDHGEAFGEKNVWFHPLETHIPELVEVPWLEIRK